MEASLSFEVRSARQFLRDLVEEDYKAFSEHPTSSRLAIHCALGCWHLTDWVWSGVLKSNQPLRSSIDPSVKDRDAFRKHVVTTCPELGIMQEIANGSKHFGRQSAIVKDSGLAGGAFDPEAFSDEFDIGQLTIETPGAPGLEFRDCLEAAVTFWRGFFQAYVP